MQNKQNKDHRYEWEEARLYIFETLESLVERLEVVEDKTRKEEKISAIDNTKWAIIWAACGVVGTKIIEIIIEKIF